MRKGVAVLLSSLVLLAGQAARANDYCPDRPGLDTPPCTMNPGRLSVEASLADWNHSSDSASITDTMLIGDLALRYGIATRAEVRLAWTPYGHVRTLDRATGQVTAASGSGDLTFGLKRNILDPGAKHLSIALLPSVTAPVGGDILGAGTWSAALQMPMSLAAGQGVTLLLTPQISAAANGDGSGRHLAYGTAGGFALAPAPHFNLAIEAAIMRDQDPAGASTEIKEGVSLGWMVAPDFQIDLGGEIGLNNSAPDHRLYLGLARRF